MVIDPVYAVHRLPTDAGPQATAKQRAQIYAAIAHNVAIEEALDENLARVRAATRKLRAALAELD